MDAPLSGQERGLESPGRELLYFIEGYLTSVTRIAPDLGLYLVLLPSWFLRFSNHECSPLSAQTGRSLRYYEYVPSRDRAALYRFYYSSSRHALKYGNIG